MSKTTSKVLAGCGVGCLLATMLAVGVGWMGYRWVQTASEALENTERSARALEETYGKREDYRPPTAAGVPADRMEVFLAVRDAMAIEREAMAEAVAVMAPEEEGSGRGGGLQMARAMAGLPSRMFSLVANRNQALLDHQMGLGEYTWIYWLTYYAWLGHSAADSEMQEIMEQRADSDERVQMHFDGGPGGDEISWQVRRTVSEMLQSLEADLAAAADNQVLHSLVVEELNALGLDPDRVPWEDGLPAEFATGLESFRERLEVTYSRATNPFELIDLD